MPRLVTHLTPVDLSMFNSEVRELMDALLDSPTSPLSDRQLRNAWMHFNERLDQAIEQGTLGNRHEVTTAAEGARAASRSVRVLEMDTLVVRYRDPNDVPRQTDLRELQYLQQLATHFGKTQRRFRALTVAA